MELLQLYYLGPHNISYKLKYFLKLFTVTLKKKQWVEILFSEHDKKNLVVCTTCYKVNSNYILAIKLANNY